MSVRSTYVGRVANYISQPCTVKHKTWDVGGSVLRFHRIGCVALAIGKTADTLRHWEATGVLPPTPCRLIVAGTDHRVRLYTDAQLEAIRGAAELTGVAGRKSFDLGATGFRELIRAQWHELFPGFKF